MKSFSIMNIVALLLFALTFNNVVHAAPAPEQVVKETVNTIVTNIQILAKNWRKASDAQRQDFVAQFQTFLMRSYATALLEYSGETVNYKDPVAKGNDRVVVKAELVSNAGEIYPVNLYMSNRKDTRWRAYNIEVAGINFVSSYRSTFGDIVSQKGIDGLLEDLKEKNAKLGV